MKNKKHWLRSIAMLLGTVLSLLILVGLTVHFQYPATVAWDAANRATSYEVYLAPPANKGELTFIAEVIDTEIEFATVPYGKWAVGVRSVRVEDDQRVVSESISWSDDPLVAPNPFTFSRLEPPDAPGNLKVE